MKLLRIFGHVLFFGGLILLVLTIWPVAKQEWAYQLQNKNFNHDARYEVVDNPELVGSEDEAKADKPWYWRPTKIVPASFDFSLVVPKLGINSPVFANIDSGNEDVYLPVLKQGVAHALNSALPNQKGTVFLFAHSTDTFYHITQYNAVFYLLHKLEPGNEIYVFYQKQKYKYQVEQIRTIPADSVSEEVASLKGNKLVLQTCWPPGTTLKRIIVIAKRVN